MQQTHRIFGRSSVLKTGGRRKGSILVFLIVLIVVFTVLGAGMVSMFGTSVLSVFATNNSRRAGYLAESGLRYTISQVRNAAASARETALTAIDDGSVNGIWFSVFPGVSRYQVRVYPYWARTGVGTGVATNSVAATVPNSGFPPGFAIPTSPLGAAVARLHIGQNNLTPITGVAGATGGSKNVTYTLQDPVTIPTGMTAYANLAFPTTSTGIQPQQITRGSTETPLVLNINAVSAIPAKNGTFMDYTAGRLYDYRTARVVGNNVQLENINWTGASATSTIAAGSYLIFSQSVRLDSTGEHLQTQKAQTDCVTLFSITSSMGGPPQNEQPKDLTEVESGFGNTLAALDTSKSGNRVVLQGYIATGGTHSYWAAFQRLGEAAYRFEDPEEAGRDIGWHVIPIADDISDDLRNSWIQYHNLSYDVQIKMGWDLNLEYAAQGVTFRWHESPLFPGVVPPGNDPYRYYQGYGITYMIYKDDNHGSNDMIPNTIKPPGGSLKKKLLLVLWEQKVTAAGVPTKDWLAYAVLGDPANERIPPALRNPADPDQKVTGNQGWPDGRLNDNAMIVVRVEDKFVTTGEVTTRCNEIKVFYGDASGLTFQNDSRTKDAVATNKQRARYYPKWLETGAGGTLAPINPQWPTNWFGLSGATIANWNTNVPPPPYNPTAAYDYFSLASHAPTAPYNTVIWERNTSPLSGFSAVDLLNDNGTIRTTDFVLDSYPSGRKEIGLVGSGNFYTSGGYPITVAFDDFYMQILGGY
jgi:hypothetical protein